jgi:hypothetical protein
MAYWRTTASLARVGLPQRRSQIPDADVGVDRRRLDASMTEEPLDAADVGAAGQEADSLR